MYEDVLDCYDCQGAGYAINEIYLYVVTELRVKIQAW